MRYDEQQSWQPSSRDEFQAAGDPCISTVIYVHGNQTDWNEAIELGWTAYHGLAGDGHDPPMRFVIYSWPSDQVCCIPKDVRIKANRADGECWYLAQLLSRIRPEAHIGLFGFSFGSRIIAGALHLRAGGEIDGNALGKVSRAEPPPVRAVLMGAALHNYWLLPGQRFGGFLHQVDQLLVQYNSCDRALKLYPHIERGARPQALGHTGVPCLDRLGESADRIKQHDVCCQLGKRHRAASYLTSPALMDEARPYLLW